MAAPSLSSPARLLAELERSTGAAPSGPALEELLEGVRAGGGGGGALPADLGAVELVTPEAGFVVKTISEAGHKVFINVCGSPKLPLPGGWRPGEVPAELRRYLEEGQGGEEPPAAMRFPLSMGPPRPDIDHRGEPCQVLDCIVSSDVLAQCGQYRPLKVFLIQLALGAAQQKVGGALDPQYRLPKMRYKGGTPPPQLIRAEGGGVGGTGGAAGAAASNAEQQQQQQGMAQRPGSGGSSKPLIAEVGSDGEEPPAFALLATKRQQRQRAATAARQGAAAEARPQQQAAAQPVSQQQQQAPAAAGQQQQQQQLKSPAAGAQLQPQVEYCGRPASEVCICVELPPAAAAAARRDPSSISAAVCAETVRLAVPGCAPAEVRLPFAVAAEGASAQLHPAVTGASSGCSLVLRLPYRTFSSVLRELRRAAGAAEGSGSGGEGAGERSSLMDLD